MKKRIKRVKCRRNVSILLVLAMLVGCFAGVNFSAEKAQAAGTASDVISLAAAQVGYHEKASNYNLDDYAANSGSGNYTKYARDLGVGNGQPWCAYFIWWCMQSAGVSSDAYPRVGYATRDWFRSRGLWHDRGTYTPKPGDYVAFGGSPDHCGIVESVSNGYVNTIEGNSGDSVKRHSYSLTNTYIMGYGTINYPGSSPVVPSTDNPGSPYPIPSGILRSGSSGDSVRWVQACVNELLGAGIAVDGQYGNQTIYAVKVFQQQNGLTVDGIVGPNTTNKMLELWKNKKAADAAPKDTTKPTISNVKISEVSLEGYRITCNVADNVKVTEVKFPTWTATDGQDDLIWYNGSLSGNTATVYVKRTDHKNCYGVYYTHIYAYDAAGNYSCVVANDVNLSQLTQPQDIGTGFYAVIQNQSEKTVLTNTLQIAPQNTDARTIKLNSITGAEDQLWYFEKQSDGSYKITSKADKRNLDRFGGQGTAQTTVWAYVDNGNIAQRWYLYQAEDGAYYLQGKSCENTLLESNSDGAVYLNHVSKSKAQQFRILKYYQVMFKNGDSTAKEQWVESGKSATAPKLVREGYELSWDKNYNSVTGDMVINAVWTKQKEIATEIPATEKPVEKPTASPKETTDPKETERPKEGSSNPEESAETRNPATSERPIVTQTPVMSDEVTETPQPTASEVVAATKTPVTSGNPTVTRTPIVTNKPVPTVAVPSISSEKDRDDVVVKNKNKSVTLNRKTFRVKRGKKVRIRVTEKSAGDYVKRYRIVGKKRIVVVSSRGVVKGLRRGRTMIKVVMHSGASVKCRVIVK